MEKKTYLKIITPAIFAFAFLVVTPQFAHAATLYFSPSSGAYEVGKTFSTNVYVSSADQAMNAASGVISFPKDKLEITSLSKSGSIFSLWVQEPAFSNGTGIINFEGIVLNPGFTGSGGKIMTVNFKVKSAGTGALNFSSGSILANDGAGTNILKGMGSADYQLSSTPGKPTEQITEEQPTVTAGVPSAPQILSSTHPDPNKWYNNKNPRFFWTLPAGVTGVGIYFSQSPTSNPGPVSDGLFANKSYENVEDGIWYFHLKFKNSYGWGPITHFKIQVDTKPPEPITIEFIDGRVVEQPRVKVIFDTVDTLSGIEYYKIKISGNLLSNISSNEIVPHNPYTLPPQSPGEHSLEVMAFDKAGNVATATEKFTIRPALPPQIFEPSRQLRSGENLEIKGETVYPQAKIVIFIQKDGEEPNRYQIITDQDGKFTHIFEETLQSGNYKLWAHVTDEKGTQGNPSEKISINVESSAFLRAGTRTIFLAVIITLVTFIIALLIILWRRGHKFLLLRKRLRKEAREAESALHKAFNLLKKGIGEEIRMLERAKTKRELTAEEEKIIRRFKKDLDAAERFVGKEIKDIEKLGK